MSDKQRRDREPTFRNLREAELDRNLDPLSKQSGSHPFGTAAGTAGGGLAGALLGGILAGPVGAAAGSVIAGVAGGLAGKAVAEQIDPTIEERYWQEHHQRQAYAEHSPDSYVEYAPAYRVAYGHFGAFDPGTQFEAAEPTLRSTYEAEGHPLGWDNARAAALQAWQRMNRAASAHGRPAERDTPYEVDHHRPKKA